MKRRDYVYYVEGQCEETLVRLLIGHFRILPPGKVKVLNITQQKFPPSLVYSFKPGTCIVFIFDTDAGNVSMAEAAIRKVLSLTVGVEVIAIPQVRNFEDELLHACSIRDVCVLTGSSSPSHFKRDFLRATNLDALLKTAGFDFARLWSREAEGAWARIRRGDIHKIQVM